MSSAIELGTIPAVFMLVFTLAGLGIHVPVKIAGALQHFAAGILLCTIGTELLPTMDEAKGWTENLSAFFGFFAGVAVMLALGYFLPEPEGDDDDNDEDNDDESNRAVEEEPKKLFLRGREESLLRQSSTVVRRQSSISGGETDALIAENSSDSVFPSVLVFAIAIDGAMDGLLIGIATAAGQSAGPMMAASLCVEMSFLGLTLAMALKGQSRISSIGASLVGPVGIVIGAAVGGFLSEAFSKNPASMTFLLSFGTSALLFMVAEELLLEAHEEGDHVWWVDLQLYTGFFASIIMGKILK